MKKGYVKCIKGGSHPARFVCPTCEKLWADKIFLKVARKYMPQFFKSPSEKI